MRLTLLDVHLLIGREVDQLALDELVKLFLRKNATKVFFGCFVTNSNQQKIKFLTCFSSSDIPGILSMKNLMFSSRLKKDTYMKLDIKKDYIHIDDHITSLPTRLLPRDLLLQLDLQDCLGNHRET